MTVQQAAMVGCDEGKASAFDRRGGGKSGGVPARGAPPPAGSDEQVAARPQSPTGGGRGRLADVGRHSTSAGPEGAAAHAVAGVRTWSARPSPRSRSSATWASSWRRREVRRAQARRRDGRVSLTFGTNRELSELGHPAMSEGALRPRLMRVLSARRSPSRRQRWGATNYTRRRDAQPCRSSRRRGRDTVGGSPRIQSHRGLNHRHGFHLTAGPSLNLCGQGKGRLALVLPDPCEVRPRNPDLLGHCQVSQIPCSHESGERGHSLMCPIGTFRVKTFVSVRTYRRLRGGVTIMS